MTVTLRRQQLCGLLRMADGCVVSYSRVIFHHTIRLILLSWVLGFGVDKPLYVVLDVYGKRLNVTDDDGNVLFMTTLQDKEPEQTATLAAIRLGGWLKGMVKSHKNII